MMRFFQTRQVQIALGISSLLFALFFIAFEFSQELWVDMDSRKADSVRWRASMALAYSCLTMLALTLSMGSVNLFRGKSNPTHNVLRRAFGICTIIFILIFVYGIAIQSLGIWIRLKTNLERNKTSARSESEI